MKTDSNENLFEDIQIMSVSEMETQNMDTNVPSGEQDPITGDSLESDNVLITKVDTPSVNVAPVNNAPITSDTGITNTPLSSKYLAFAKELADEGLVNLTDETEVDTLDKLKELVKTNLENDKSSFKESFKTSFSGAKKKFLEIEDSFEDENVAISVAKDLAYYESIDDTKLNDNETAKSIYEKYLTAKGFSEKEIESQIEDAEVLDKLTEKAKLALPWLKQSTEEFVTEQRLEKEKAITLAKENETKTVSKIINTIDSTEYFIKDLPLNKVVKDKIKASMSEVVHTTKDGKSLTDLAYKQFKNPESFAILINYYNSIGLLNQNENGEFVPDISKLTKIAKTQSTKELDKILAAEETSTGINGKPTRNSSSILNNLENIFKK